ncbi:MAG: EGF-like domain [Bacteroidota bacterium]|jgi:hypothetical protein
MKKTLYYGFVLLAFLQVSCDPCANNKCENGGDCANGRCYCPLGYEGKSCETEWSARFVKGFASVTGCNKTYSVDIQRIDNQTIKIYNLGGFTNQSSCLREQTAVKGKLISSTYFKIDETFCTGYHLQGDGTFNVTTKKMTLNYHCDFPSGNEDCALVFDY